MSITSCQKVIDVDLNDSDPKVVIEANFIATDSIVQVKVSKTSSYFDPYEVSTINNAVIEIIDGNGVSTIIPNIGDGMYELSGYIPMYGTTYTMNVTLDGVLYSSTSELLQPLVMEVPSYEFVEESLFNEEGYLVFFRFQDPQGLGNCYKVIYQKNDTLYNKLEEMTFGDDELTDGNLIERPIFETFQIGDTVGFELQSINPKMYSYYTQLLSNTNGNSAAPANPDYVWTNEALGYFSAYGYSKNGAVIQ